MKRAIIIVVTCLVGNVAHAEDRDPDTALELTVGGSAAAVAFAIPAGNTTTAEWRTGLPLLICAELAPTIGHLYAGDYLSPGLFMRVAGGGLLALGFNDPLYKPSDGVGLSTSGGIAVLAGLGLSIGGIVYDIATARSATRRTNAHHVDVMPTAYTGASTGVGLVGAF